MRTIAALLVMGTVLGADTSRPSGTVTVPLSKSQAERLVADLAPAFARHGVRLASTRGGKAVLISGRHAQAAAKIIASIDEANVQALLANILDDLESAESVQLIALHVAVLVRTELELDGIEFFRHMIRQ